jgi:hypothetical protein
LVLIHRYLGIILSLLFLVWFLSGIAMIYAKGMPRLTPELRLQRLPAIDFSRVHITPAEAAAQSKNPARVALGSILGRPVYRFGAGRSGGTIVFADDGTILEGVDGTLARAIAADFMDVSEGNLRYKLITRADQWTLASAGKCRYIKSRSTMPLKRSYTFHPKREKSWS